MAWLQKRPQVALPMNYVTMGQANNLLIVGLGNPETKYSLTRHNIGFECVDYLVSKYDEFSPWIEKKDLKCHFSSGRFGDNTVMVIKPTTYMNLSGEAVRAVVNFYKLQTHYIAVVHDDIDIKFGLIRTKLGGSDAGHNGIKSIIEHLGENFGRVRIGIGPKKPPEMDTADFVLQKFNEKEIKQFDNLKKETTAILSEFIYNKSLLQETRPFIV